MLILQAQGPHFENQCYELQLEARDSFPQAFSMFTNESLMDQRKKKQVQVP